MTSFFFVLVLLRILSQAVRASGSCSGTPTGCSTTSYSSLCNRIDGCYWTSYGSYNYCGGNARGCSGCSSESSCEDQGCSWEEDSAGSGTNGGNTAPSSNNPVGFGCPHEMCCSGTAYRCEDSSGPQGCDDVAGCTWYEYTYKCGEWARPCDWFNGAYYDEEEEEDCKKQGCDWKPSAKGTSTDCTGPPKYCTSYTESECSEIQGCRWSYTGSTCFGHADVCDAFTDQASCLAQKCEWTSSGGATKPENVVEECVGTAKTCESHASGDLCVSTIGCEWVEETACVGSARQCESLSSKSECEQQEGCAWKVTRSAASDDDDYLNWLLVGGLAGVAVAFSLL